MQPGRNGVKGKKEHGRKKFFGKKKSTSQSPGSEKSLEKLGKKISSANLIRFYEHGLSGNHSPDSAAVSKIIFRARPLGISEGTRFRPQQHHAPLGCTQHPWQVMAINKTRAGKTGNKRISVPLTYVLTHTFQYHSTEFRIFLLHWKKRQHTTLYGDFSCTFTSLYFWLPKAVKRPLIISLQIY